MDACVVALAIECVLCAPHSAIAQADGYRTDWAGGLVTHIFSQEGYPNTLAVVDPRRQVLGVYHVDTRSGAITLKSVRNMTWDLQMPEFNSKNPTPQDVRSGLEKIR